MTSLPDSGWLVSPSSQHTDLAVLQAGGTDAMEGTETANDPPGGEGSQCYNAVDEVYADARHLLGPLIDVLGEGEMVHNRESGLVDRSQRGGTK